MSKFGGLPLSVQSRISIKSVEIQCNSSILQSNTSPETADVNRNIMQNSLKSKLCFNNTKCVPYPQIFMFINVTFRVRNIYFFVF